MIHVQDFLPRQVNAGPWLVSYTLDELRRRIAHERVVLPICSLETPAAELTQLGPLVLPPLYHEGLDGGLRDELLARIRHCFPYFAGTQARVAWEGQFDIVELPRRRLSPNPWDGILALSVDTAVEQHGPHLPLATDTIQSYAVLEQLAREFPAVRLAAPVEYGQLTWGLPFGLSIDISAPLLTRYVTNLINGLVDLRSPRALYVVDVHGSIVHRTAIQAGLAASRCERWAFRWLYDPLGEFTADRGDQHAGGVETALVQRASPSLVDARWWPARIDELAAGQMPMARAIELSPTLDRFIAEVETGRWNGIVGDVHNFHRVNADALFARMLEVAQQDVRHLLEPA